MTARDRALFLNDAMPAGLFGGVGVDAERVAWRLSPEPFAISPQTLAAIQRLGPDLLRFYRALASLYQRSVRGTAPAFIAEYLDHGKPEAIIKLGRQNRLRGDIPSVIRPDLILTESGFIASELDNVPGGMGFVGAMAQAYCELGYDTVGDLDGMPAGLAAALRAASGKEQPITAAVVSVESGDYRAELEWLAAAMNRRALGETYVCKPEDIVFTEEALFVRLPGGEEKKLDVLYRNFELFDLLNIAKHDLVLYAARHNRVKITPPPKAHLEEKLAFALLHHPLLAKTWKSELGEAFGRLLTIFPQTWVLDPRPLPPQAAILGLTAGGEPVHDWAQLIPLGKSERDFVVKPSGFSELAWGSRGVKVANDLTKEEWQRALESALAGYDTTPYVLQRFHKGKRVKVAYFDRKSDDVRQLDGRVRLCPYYFVSGDDIGLGGILATIAAADKRLIHGMSDAIMSPCTVREDGY
ncbi:MAG: hypothetical protein GIX03_02520 [Candidatus Eremiobacteraeota bacterium]|nr:hypothetical protein [Candidatus Eremiobacteraeota bacterium]MBC5801890.1 hypothetical protein [Candidatus Eremiobacteraeota bacterium]MBC5820829.1 hypothetical protein [Candidatus Eremiobacteraeota bacterium]